MKKRNGFVSNSSSSSFIIGVGKIKPSALETVKGIVKENQGDLEIWTIADLIEKQKSSKYWCGPTFRDFSKCLEVESFTNAAVSLKIYPEDMEDGHFLVMMHDGGGDDSDFSVLDDDGDFIEMDYDLIDIHCFSSAAQELQSLFYDKNLIENGETTFGAGRDG